MSRQETVFVAMSGGVDSSVAAGLLLEQAYPVEGVTMCFELPAGPADAKPSCCGLGAIEDARRVCRHLGMRHHVLNYGDVLEREVIQDFVDEYRRGRTPNPCVRCNRQLKFDRLFRDAVALGASRLATGHYARIEETPSGWVLRKAVDPRKDQSYFLCGVPRAVLPRVLFPLGGLTKDEVRAAARRMGLPVAEKKESQDICFVPGGDYRALVSARTGEPSVPGDVLDASGRKVGTHQGAARYTVGQREGLGLALGYPAFVTAIDAAANIVHVGPRDRLLAAGVLADQLNLVSMDFSQETVEAGVKIRYNHQDIPAVVDFPAEDRLRVRFHEPRGAVTPGQAVAFYRGDILLGGARIASALPLNDQLAKESHGHHTGHNVS